MNILFYVCLLSLVLSIETKTCNWIGVDVGSFVDPANWDCNRSPQQIDDAIISEGGQVLLSTVDRVTIGSLTLSKNSDLTVAGSLNLFGKQGNIFVDSSSVLEITPDGSIQGSFVKQLITVNGTFEVLGALGGLAITNNNSTQISSSADVNLNGTTLINTEGGILSIRGNPNADKFPYILNIVNHGVIDTFSARLECLMNMNNVGTFNAVRNATSSSSAVAPAPTSCVGGLWTNVGQMNTNGNIIISSSLDNVKGASLDSRVSISFLGVTMREGSVVDASVMILTNGTSKWDSVYVPSVLRARNGHVITFSKNIDSISTMLDCDTSTFYFPKNVSVGSISSRHCNINVTAHTYFEVDEAFILESTSMNNNATTKNLNITVVGTVIIQSSITIGGNITLEIQKSDVQFFEPSKINGDGNLVLRNSSGISVDSNKILWSVPTKIFSSTIKIHLEKEDADVITGVKDMYIDESCRLVIHTGRALHKTRIIAGNVTYKAPTDNIPAYDNCMNTSTLIIDQFGLELVPGQPKLGPPKNLNVRNEITILEFIWEEPAGADLCTDVYKLQKYVLSDGDDTTWETEVDGNENNVAFAVNSAEISADPHDYTVIACAISTINGQPVCSNPSEVFVFPRPLVTTSSSNVASNFTGTLSTHTSRHNDVADEPEDGMWKLFIALGFLGTVFVIVAIAFAVVYIRKKYFKTRPSQLLLNEEEDDYDNYD